MPAIRAAMGCGPSPSPPSPAIRIQVRRIRSVSASGAGSSSCALQHPLPADVLPGRPPSGRPRSCRRRRRAPEALRVCHWPTTLLTALTTSRAWARRQDGDGPARLQHEGVTRFEVEQSRGAPRAPAWSRAAWRSLASDDGARRGADDVEDVLERPQQCFGAPRPGTQGQGGQLWSRHAGGSPSTLAEAPGGPGCCGVVEPGLSAALDGRRRRYLSDRSTPHAAHPLRHPTAR